MALWDGVYTLVGVLISLLLLHLLLHIRGTLVSGGRGYSTVAVDEESIVRLDHSKRCERLRADGWASNFYVCLLVAGSFCVFPGRFVPLMYPVEPEMFLNVFVIYALDTGRSLLSMALQFFLNCKWFEMDMDDLSLIRRRRDTWLDRSELQALINKYGEKPIKIMDAVNRRFGHLAHYSIHVGVFARGNTTQRCMLQTFFFLAIFRSLMHVALETNDCLGVVDYSGVRMRDGCLGRFKPLGRGLLGRVWESLPYTRTNLSHWKH